MNEITLKQAVSIIAAVGHQETFLAQGDAGIGKSSMLGELSRRFPDYIPIYLDATTLDVGDLCIPRIAMHNGQAVTEFVPNITLGFHSTKPILLMIDELGKASKAVVNAFLRVLLERKLHHYALPEGSIVFATTNLAAEGLGDMLAPHVRNRITTLKIRKPTSDEWVEDYALPKHLHPVIVAAAREFPQFFESFEQVEDPSANNYIYHPKQQRPAFVTPRSLEKASNILYGLEGAGINDLRLFTHALSGAVGAPAAADIMTLKTLEIDLPKWKDILNDPLNTPVPESGACMIMLVTRAALNVDQETLTQWMPYCNRLRKEAQALFAKTIQRVNKLQMAADNEAFFTWAKENTSWLFG